MWTWAQRTNWSCLFLRLAPDMLDSSNVCGVSSDPKQTRPLPSVRVNQSFLLGDRSQNNRLYLNISSTWTATLHPDLHAVIVNEHYISQWYRSCIVSNGSFNNQPCRTQQWNWRCTIQLFSSWSCSSALSELRIQSLQISVTLSDSTTQPWIKMIYWIEWLIQQSTGQHARWKSWLHYSTSLLAGAASLHSLTCMSSSSTSVTLDASLQLQLEECTGSSTKCNMTCLLHRLLPNC